MLRGELAGAVHWAVSDRRGGVSAAPYDALNLADHVGDDPVAVAENRRLLRSVLRRSAGGPTRLAFMQQVHGRDVAVVDGPSGDGPSGDGPNDNPVVADALVTATPGLALVVLVADCVPLLMADPVAGVVAAVHAGRRGVHAGVALAALDAMAALGAQPQRTRCLLGPSVCPACYPVPEALRTEVAAQVPAAFSATPDGEPALDLRAGLAAVLAERGVTAESVGPCTAETPWLYSHRRDGVTGRFAGVVWMDR